MPVSLNPAYTTIPNQNDISPVESFDYIYSKQNIYICNISNKQQKIRITNNSQSPNPRLHEIKQRSPQPSNLKGLP